MIGRGRLGQSVVIAGLLVALTIAHPARPQTGPVRLECDGKIYGYEPNAIESRISGAYASYANGNVTIIGIPYFSDPKYGTRYTISIDNDRELSFGIQTIDNIGGSLNRLNGSMILLWIGPSNMIRFRYEGMCKIAKPVF